MPQAIFDNISGCLSVMSFLHGFPSSLCWFWLYFRTPLFAEWWAQGVPKWCESAQPQTQNQHISINVFLSRCCRICIVSHHSKERSLRYKDFLNGHRQWPRYFLIWNWQFLLTHFKNGLCTHNRYKTLCDLALVLLVQLNFDIQANYQFR